MEELKKIAKKVKWDSIIASILSIALGILCVVMPNHSANVLCIFFGVSLIVMGVILFIRFVAFESLFGEHILIFAILMVIAGAFCLIYPNVIQSILTVLFGIYIVVDSASTLNDSIYLARSNTKGWVTLFIISLLTLVLGVAVMFSTFETVMIFAGVSLIIEGVEHIIVTCVYSHKIKEAKKTFKQIVIDSEEK